VKGAGRALEARRKLASIPIRNVGLDREDAGLEVHPAITIAQAPFEGFQDVRIAVPKEPIGELDDRDLRAQGVVEAGHFEADDPAADDQEALGDGAEPERSGRIQDPRVFR
jgi:hypothetical protein